MPLNSLVVRSEALWVVGLLLLGLTACGASEPRHDSLDANAYSRAMTAALKAGKISGRDLFAAPVRIDLDEDWETYSSIPEVERPFYYKVLGRLYGGQLHVDEICVEQAAVDKVLREDTTGNATGQVPRGYVGEGYTVVGLPPEFGYWLALADLFRESQVEDQAAVDRRGFGTTKHAQISKSQGKDSSGGMRSDLSAVRDLVQFRVSPEVSCVGQFKIFHIDERAYVSPSDEADRRLRQEDPRRKSATARREALGLSVRARGQLMWEMKSETDEGGWTLRIHVAHDTELARVKGEVIDQSLLCRSESPMLATEITGYRRKVSRVDGGVFKVQVWRGGAGR